MLGVKLRVCIEFFSQFYFIPVQRSSASHTAQNLTYTLLQETGLYSSLTLKK